MDAKTTASHHCHAETGAVDRRPHITVVTNPFDSDTLS